MGGRSNSVKSPIHGPPLEKLAAHIRLYLTRRPRAADTVRGIVEVWLADIEPEPARDEVLAALLYLEALGDLERVRLPDGSELWRRAG